MVNKSNKILPDFEKPPVIEVVCGIQFIPIPAFSVPYIGILWDKFKADYPNCREVTPLMPVVEQFGEDSRGDVFPYSGELPPPRVWFESGDSNRLIQVQRDRFLHNWKKERDADIYPHYDHVVGNFRTSLETFEKFLEDRKLGRIEPTQYELTYINHVLKEDGWEEPDDIGNIFPDFSWRKSDKRFLRTPESMNWQTSFLLPERSGRLRLSIRLGRRKSDQRTTILLELTARGIGVDKTRSSMWSWFDMAHEWIVCGFTDLTAEDIHRKFWRRIR